MGQTLRARMAVLIRDLNTLAVGASVQELHDMMAALAATQNHVVSLLLTAACQDADRPKRVLTMPEVAERLHVSVCTARELGRRRELVTVCYGRAVRVTEEALERYIREHQNGVCPREAGKVRPGLPGSVGETSLGDVPPNPGRTGRRER